MIGIIGGGLSAAKAVESYREAGGTDDIVLWSQDPHGPYHRPPLTKRLLRGESKPEDALISLEGVDLRLGERIESLDAVEADTIVLATGATPRKLGDALAFRTLDDSLDLRRRAESAKTATVIGGGFIGCEITASLTMIGVKVTQIVRDPMLFATIECPPLSESLHEIYRANGVDLRLEASDIPDADIVVAGIGVEPNVELARDAGLEVRSGVVVDERFRTSRDGRVRDRRRRRVLRPALRPSPPDRALVDRGLPRDDARQDPRRRRRGPLRHGLVVLLRRVRTQFPVVRRRVRARRHRRSRATSPATTPLYRFLKGGATISAVAIGLDDEEQDALKDEIRAGAAAHA